MEEKNILKPINLEDNLNPVNSTSVDLNEAFVGDTKAFESDDKPIVKNDESKVKIINNIIDNDDDDIIFSSEEDDLLETTPQGFKIYKNDTQGKPKNNLIDEVINEKELSFLMGKSDSVITKNEEKKPTSIYDVLDEFKKLGEYIDVYLPMSNIAVRIYEFENDLFLPEFYNNISSDFGLSNIYGDITYDRVLLTKIFQNCEVLCADSDKVTEYDLEKISNSDIPLLILSCAKLLVTSASKKDIKDDGMISIDSECESCNRLQKIEVNLDDILQSTYKKYHIDDLRNIYNINDTFEQNYKRSYTYATRKKGVRYSKDDRYEIRVICKDPSYIESITRESVIIKYLLSQYEKEKSIESIVNSNVYKIKNNKNKFYTLLNSLVYSTSNDQEQEAQREKIMSHLGIMQLLSYIGSIYTVDVANGVIISENNINETPIEELFDIIKKFPAKLINSLTKRIEELNDKASDKRITYNFKCSSKTCNTENEVELGARALVFSILQKRQDSISEED